jgi:hypothetical protein
MSEIFNKDVSVLGDLTLALQNSAGNVVTVDGTGITRFRTLSELSTDLSIATGSSDANFIHDQSTPSATWTIIHGLNKRASITVVDTAGTVIVGQIDYTDDNNVVLTFNNSFSGYAYFN